MQVRDSSHGAKHGDLKSRRHERDLKRSLSEAVLKGWLTERHAKRRPNNTHTHTKFSGHNSLINVLVPTLAQDILNSNAHSCM